MSPTGAGIGCPKRLTVKQGSGSRGGALLLICTAMMSGSAACQTLEHLTCRGTWLWPHRGFQASEAYQR